MAISSSATGLRPGVCTSTTRPTAPYTGQTIYETDTGYLRVWNGSAWDYLSQKQTTTQGLPAGDSMGLVHIGTTSLSSGGSYTISNAFSSSYRNYRVVGTFTRDTASTGYCLLRLGGATTDHVMSGQYSTWNSATRTGDNGADGYLFLSAQGANYFSADIYAPNLAQYSYYVSHGGGPDYTSWTNVRVANTTQYTSFSVVLTAGNFTGGSLQLYGYRYA